MPSTEEPLLVTTLGAKIDGTDTAGTTNAIKGAMQYCSANKKSLVFPGGNYSITPGTVFNIGNIPSISAKGAIFEDGRFSDDPTSSYYWEGGLLKQVNDTSDQSLFSVYGHGIRINGISFKHEKSFGGVCIRGGHNIQIRDYIGYGTGSPPIVLYGHDITMDNLIFPNHDKDNYWDDCITLDAVGGDTYNITINNVIVNGFSDIIAIGTAINPNSNKNHPFGVYGVTVSNCVGRNVEYGIFIKPGNRMSGYSNGYVEDISFSNFRIHDKMGNKLKTPIRITPSNGARVKDVSFTDVQVKGRMSKSNQEAFLLFPYEGASIESVQFTNIGYTDTYNGLPHSDNEKGYPPIYGLHIKPFDTSLVKDIMIDNLRINGTSANPIFVEKPVEDLVIRDPHIRNTGSDMKIAGNFIN